MLGKLARWLRIMGYDTEYYVDKNDEELILESLCTKRILISRDSTLIHNSLKKGASGILIISDNIENQLHEVCETLELNLSPKNTRCPRCNGCLKPVKKELIKKEIPDRTYKLFNDFWKCSKCKKNYWKGSHWIHILETLQKININSKNL
jgi:uncharacterized protein with PIN domain